MSATLTNPGLAPLTVLLKPRTDAVLRTDGVGVLTVGAPGSCPQEGEPRNVIYRTMTLTWPASHRVVILRHAYLNTGCGHVTANGYDIRP